MKIPHWLLGIFGLALAFPGVTSLSAAYPERTITLIVAYPPGGSTDVSTRLFAPFLEKHLPPKSRIVVINRGGAGGELGTLEIANAKPDGYTLGIFNVPNTAMKAHERRTRWSIGSFAPIANLVYDPAMLAVRADSRFRNAAELVAEAKKNPGKITVASAGAGSNTHLDIIALEKAAGIKLVHVPFEGGAQSRNAVLGGHTELMASALGDTLPYFKEGKLRPIGIYTKARPPTAPDVPTFAEQGFPLEGGSARGLVGPKALPKAIIEVLEAAAAKAMADPEFLKKADQAGISLRFMNAAEYGKYLEDSNRELAELWKTSPWK